MLILISFKGLYKNTRRTYRCSYYWLNLSTMPISEKQSRELADLKLFYDLVNKNSDTISINYKIFL